MIDSRTRVGKMIDKDKIVLECLHCGYKTITDLNNKEILKQCPACTQKNCLVVRDNYYVIKG